MKNTEEIRQSFRPDKINLLFVAESPPRGGTFFYFQNSNLYFAVKEAFERIFTKFDHKDFLEFFKEQGCYLEDLCLTPVNGLMKSKRAEERLKGIEPLAQRINEHKPKGIVILMRGIETEVRTAIVKSNIQSVKLIKVTSFPSYSESNRLDCISGVQSALLESMDKRIIKTPPNST